MRERLKWWIAFQVNRLQSQCWADLVSWVLRERRDNAGAGIRARLPWQPIGNTCQSDAARTGRCYCGALGSDGVRLRAGETVCVTMAPGRTDRMCSRPNGHQGLHRCGGLEWGAS